MIVVKARCWRMPFGKHRGQLLGSIAMSEEGRDYLAWLSDQDWVSEPLRQAARSVLDAIENPREKCAADDE